MISKTFFMVGTKNWNLAWDLREVIQSNQRRTSLIAFQNLPLMWMLPNFNSGGFWVTNDTRSTEVEEEKRAEAGNKRKNLFDEINHQKKREREAHHTDLHDKSRTSHISITTDEGSTAENEDVADSEAEASTSRLASHRDDGCKQYSGGGSLSEVPKNFHWVDSSGVDLQGQQMFSISSEKEFKIGNMPYGVQYQAQSANIMNMPYSSLGKESNPSGAPIHHMMQVMTAVNSERPGTQPVLPANAPLMFGYPTVQLPMLEKDNSRGLVSHPQQLHPSYTGRDLPNSGAVHRNLHKSSEATQYDGTGRTLERAKGDWKQHVTEGGTSSQTGDEMKKGSMIFRPKDASDQPRAEGLPSEFSGIRPGIAADLKFGGCGSSPNLPWVSTTGPGPNGRTISGVTYRCSATQIRIVCACHGLHMSPEEFVAHAGEKITNPESGNGLASLPSSNPAASAQI
ncbi:unnamed protein product [Ilex paraguariensis]|uniref:Ninja-family protein n=1 Tax=Ilex paraguariensis TaxID=185542 RepID=A0ABC8TU66_9AQUA